MSKSFVSEGSVAVVDVRMLTVGSGLELVVVANVGAVFSDLGVVVTGISWSCWRALSSYKLLEVAETGEDEC